MQVKELMTERPEYIDANTSIRDAAMRMMEEGRGFAPVAEGEKLVGIVTDRDIATRAMVNGKTPDDKVSTVMTAQVLFCYEDEDINDILANMHQQHVQRLVVLNNEESKDFVGVVSLSDIAEHCGEKDFDTMKRITDCCREYH
ncbi:CBS domain-containing protein [Marinimicrobium sp. ABcell2]|uniref:CBS domain-containing protein n=1 Tax=Marinimicrobium sp. ABcell2 TaxID=3069751 RepID=UPI0027B33928|nr:CBS domain-containing protein [Marinimicrobium sp. ABcell2]MDQ2077775.1 CBS domain-containing protein [Marinimicrobium sp. ABcell2]